MNNVKSFFVCLLVVLALTSTSLYAQQTAVAKIAYISTQPEAVVKQRAAAIQEELERRWPRASANRPEIVFDIWSFQLSNSSSVSSADALAANRAMFTNVMRSNPKIIYAAGAAAAKLAREYTTVIPIVLGCKCNPGPTSSVWRLVLNMCAPEGNITGFTRYDVRIIAPTAIDACDSRLTPNSVKLDNLFGIRLEILRNASEKPMSRVGLLHGEDYDEAKWQYSAKALSQKIDLVPVRLTNEGLKDLQEAFRTQRLDAGIVVADSFLDRNTNALIRATAQIPKPILFPWDEADSGAWMHYGTKVDLASAAADYFIPLLQGRSVNSLPVSFPTEYELVVNHKLAKQHGWIFPRRFLLQPHREPHLP